MKAKMTADKLQISDWLVRAFGFFVIGGLIFVAAQASQASQAGRWPVIAVMSMSAFRSELPQVRGLIDGLAEAGYVDGEKISLRRIAASSPAELRTTLTELMKGPVELLVATSSADAAIAKSITTQIPIVFAPAREPVESGLVKSLAQPATNLTGLSYSRGAEDSAKQLAVFKQMWPPLKRVALFYPARGASAPTLRAIRRAGRITKTDLIEHPVESVSDIEQFLARSSLASGDGILNICSALFRGLNRLTAIAERASIPVFGCSATQVAEEGALLSYAPDIYYLGYRGAWYVDRLLKGASPQELPVEVPSKFELVINLNVAKKLGIRIPPQMLILADKVFP